MTDAPSKWQHACNDLEIIKNATQASFSISPMLKNEGDAYAIG
jgi:hypothetical protein